MVEVNGLKFETSIGVLFALKEKRGHRTLQETYSSVGNTSMDNMLDVLCVCHSRAVQDSSCTMEDFVERLGKYGIGLIKVSSVFTQVLEKLLYDGMSEEEIAESKKQIAAQMEKKKIRT